MRRWLTVFLLFLLPLQLSWAVAATYCAHEADPAVNHIGHHQHRHEASEGATKASGARDPADLSSAGDRAGEDGGTAAGKTSGTASGTSSDKASDKTSDKALTCVDDDCGFCHLGHSQPVASTPIVLPAVASPVSSTSVSEVWSSRGPDRRERPNWQLA